MACSFEADRSFGPAVSHCRRMFDFTLLFEEIFFQLLPSCLFLIATAIRLAALYQEPPTIRRSVRYTIKLSAVTTFAALQVITLILICIQNADARTSVSVPAAGLSVVAAFALIWLSHNEHTRSVRPSFLIGLYLCITVLIRAATVRTYWLLNPHGAIASTTFAGVVVQLILIALESRSKKQDLSDGSQKVSDEESASFVSRSLFTWLNKLFIAGYQRTLTALDLESIDVVLSASHLANDFERLQKNPTTGRFVLPIMTLRCLGLYAFAPVLPRLCLTGFTFAQPFLTTSLIAYFSGQGPASDNNGYGLIGASFLVYLGIAVSTGWYWHLAYKCVTKIRGGLVGIIFDKMMRLRQEKGVESKVLTLMISDVQRIIGALAYGHEFWVAPIETGLATWLLWRQIGPSSLTVLGIALLSTVGSTYVGKNIGIQQQVWLAATEKRISATKKMLSSLKAIKMMGASERVSIVIERLRHLEFAASKSFRTFIVGSLYSSYSTLTLAPVLAFGAYIGAARATHEDFNASRMFASLIIINLLASPLLRLLQIIPSFGAAMGCFTRLEKFLERPEGIKFSEFPPACGSGQFETETVLPDKFLAHDGKRYSGISTDVPIISIRNGDFGWEAEPVLKGINLEINPGEHVVITGPVGCGKSLLLQAILGEVEPKAGSVYIGGAGIGYCGQSPWLENITARENAFRCATGDEPWEQTLIEACALGDFLDSQDLGEAVGSGGARISGGERQRLALARAIASRPAILLLDDVLSAIDRTTKRTIMQHMFGPNGILRKHGKTVIHVTQDFSLARDADKVFKIDENGHLASFEIPSEVVIDEYKDVIVESASEKSAINTTTNAKSPSPPREEKSSATKITDRKVYQTYFHSIGRPNIFLFFAFAIAFAFTLKFPDVWAKWWSEASTGNSTRSTGYWIGLYAFLSILPLAMVSLWVAHLMLKIVPKSGVGLHNKLLNSVLNASFVFLSGIDSGSIINRFNQDLMLVDTRLPLDLLNTVSSLFTCFAQVTLVVVATAYLLAALPVLALVLFIIQHVYLRTSKQLRQLDLQSKSGLHTKLSESWEGLVTIRAHGWQSMIRREFHEKLDRSQEPLYLLYMVQTWLRLVLNLLVAGLSVVIVGVAVATRHKTGASGIGVAFLNLVSLGETMANLITSWTSLETSLGAIARIQAFEDDTPREPEIEELVEVPAEWPASGKLNFDHVWASYYPDAEKPLWSMRDVTFQISAGERVAVCGRSGAGKSTLLLSLLGLIETPRGIISIDGIDVSRVSRSLLRSRLHVISQDAFIQGEAVREALNPEGNAPDEVINEVLRDCALLDKINASGGLSANFSDINLSVGETQLFVLARTILQASKQGGVVLFDEATSSIDVATEQKIMNLVKERLKGNTVVSILHRLEAAMEFDRILVLENGEVACFGTPEEVVRDSELFEKFSKGS